MNYWLFKSEPDAYSFADLKREKDRTTCWDGIRNYQARNTLRDRVRVGDRVLFYHSRVKPMAVVGTARVVREAYPDPTQFDASSRYHDPGSDPENPRWVMVDIRHDMDFDRPVTLAEIKATPSLADMFLVRKGMRLSVQPVTAKEWKTILGMGRKKGS